MLELWDADLHHRRATACEVLSKQLCVVSKAIGFATWSLTVNGPFKYRDRRGSRLPAARNSLETLFDSHIWS